MWDLDLGVLFVIVAMLVNVAERLLVFWWLCVMVKNNATDTVLVANGVLVLVRGGVISCECVTDKSCDED